MLDENPLSGPPLDDPFLDRLRPVFQLMGRYHRYRTHGLGLIPKTGRVLVVVNHSFATYDGMLLGAAILMQLRRMPYGLADSNFFKFGPFGRLASRLGMVEASHENAERVLNDGKLLLVAPGGMREALRPVSQRYQVLWQKRKGFVRLALRTQTPIVLAACPQADSLYEVYPNKLTVWAYKHIHWPLVLLKGIGPTFIPKPIQLEHHISEPLIPPACDSDCPEFEDEVTRFHDVVSQRMGQLMGLH